MVQRTALMRNFKRDTDLIGSRFKNLLVRHNDKLCVIVFIVLDRLVEHFQTINIRSQGACDRCLVLFPILFDLLGGHRRIFQTVLFPVSVALKVFRALHQRLWVGINVGDIVHVCFRQTQKCMVDTDDLLSHDIIIVFHHKIIVLGNDSGG